MRRGARLLDSRSLLAALIGLAVGGPAPARAGDAESINARGIFVGGLVGGLSSGGLVVLFTQVHVCRSEPTLPAARILVSRDGGKTWTKEGPAIDRAELEYARVDGDGVWVAGLYTAEGPGIDPFILIPAGASPGGHLDWSVQTIHDGPADLRGLAWGDGGLVAWVRHLDLQDDAKSTMVVHRSADGGHTWAPIDAASARRVKPRHRFTKIGKRAGAWRIVDRRDGGFDVQHQGGGRWRAVAEFPWRGCGGG